MAARNGSVRYTRAESAVAPLDASFVTYLQIAALLSAYCYCNVKNSGINITDVPGRVAELAVSRQIHF